MKKLLSILLVIALAAALLSGCTPKTNDPNATPTPVVKEGLKIDPAYGTEKDENGVWTDVITFNVFNTEDYQTRWSDYAKAWMLENFHLKVGYVVPAITGFTNTWDICQNKVMEDPANRAEYKSKLVSLFLSEKTRPDYLPALYASCMGVDGSWFAISDYLVDLAPYVVPGGALYDGYVGWAWGDEADYWEQMKSFIMDDMGHLYALPRKEEMPIQTFLGYSTTQLEAMGVSWDEKPTKWDDFLELLRKYMAYEDTRSGSDFGGQFYKAAFRTNEENGADLIQFIASTYGLDFNADFSWTTKNGEPLWTYIWPEYLEILKDVNLLAAEELVITNAEECDYIANYTLDKTDATYKASISGQSEAGAFSGIAGYFRDDKYAWFTTNGRSTNAWKTSDTWVTQEGYDYSMVGGTQFDSNYIAIGNALGDVFTSRIIDFLNFSLCDFGYARYCFGKEGTPFGDTMDDAGNFIYDEDGKVVFTNHANRFSFTKVEDHYWWDQRDENWWINKDPHYAQYIANYNEGEYKNIAVGDGETLKAKLGLDTCVWENDQYRVGTWFFGDVTSYPMEKTAYWPDESMSSARPNIDKVFTVAEANNSLCYKGFFRSTKDIEGKDANAMDKKIANLSSIARNYTIEFLSGKQTEAGWTNYVKSLMDAGYREVYNYYNTALEGCVTSYKEGVKSQSEVNKNLAENG